MDAITQAKHKARVLISEARVRRIGHGHGFWCFLNSAQSARLRAAALPRPAPPTLSIQPELFA
ncbi:hypothetical protein B8X02_17670 [Stenotrophomonas rhizophila]|uniref:hypothetical protein n=1 Tax=Stenotrophomonas rhizophila TaxID=216778 RepID=UPI000BA544D1|nr:hypothetical protein [Stenotrophomonas rhizophila]PAK89415.1 hypothetical protein B8X02_17670 [Stenotrophomonas rhizophila]